MPGRAHLRLVRVDRLLSRLVRSLRPRLPAVLGATAAAALVTGGCGRTVEVAAVDNPPAACAGVLAELPDRLDGHDERRVSTPRSARAYGDPAIVVRCGVGRPPGYDPSRGCFQIDHVGWYTETARGGTFFTTVWARPRVEVAVPSAYTPAADPVVDTTRAIQGRLAHPGCPP